MLKCTNEPGVERGITPDNENNDGSQSAPSYSEVTKLNFNKPKRSLIIGDSMIRDLTCDTFENTDIKCIRGATTSTIRDSLNTMDVSVYDHIVVHVGTNDISMSIPLEKTLSNFEEIVTSTQVSQVGSKIAISGPCPRLDQYSQGAKQLDISLQDLSSRLDCRYIQLSASMTYADGEADTGLFADNVHLNHKGTDRLIDKLTQVPWLCRSSSRYRRLSNSDHRVSNPDRFRRGNWDRRDYHDYRRLNPRHETSGNRNPSQQFPRRSQYSRYVRGCYNCGENNHNLERCRFDRPIQCRSCGRHGHKEKNCMYKRPTY
ncbi:hypothetical protein HOLleu_15422 [Holothuria leucospilota]|uniref:CCHC-type domain-containing protein n=1 Tax=Holothuria leucospilota TaxID=206669 RepID=A0A9Q1CA81_HOLLE|nr:hypothetical protein HOLleu_15422 [Holothuria leucospilota]